MREADSILMVKCRLCCICQSVGAAFRLTIHPGFGCPQEADVYLLDDVLAAVDPRVAQWLLEHAICGSMMQGRTRVLCTHAAAALHYADLVWHLEHGSLASCSPAARPQTASGQPDASGNDVSPTLAAEQGASSDHPGVQLNRQGADQSP